MANIEGSTASTWWNTDSILDGIGMKLNGTPNAPSEYYYTVAHTSQGYKIRSNTLDSIRCGQIRLPRTAKRLSAIDEIRSELAKYGKRQNKHKDKWDFHMSQRDRDLLTLHYLFGKLHYKVLCREHNTRHYDSLARYASLWWVMSSTANPNSIWETLQSSIGDRKRASEMKQIEADQASQAERDAQAAANAEHIWDRSEILDL